MTDRTQRYMQACALFARQPLHQDLVTWRPPVVDVGDLLGENEFEEFAMRARKRVEIGTTTTSESSDCRKPGGRRSLEQVMTNREYTRARNDAKETCFLEINAAVLGSQATKHGDARVNLSRGLCQQFGEAGVALRRVESGAP